MNFQQFIPIKNFHLVSYLLLMNLWRSGSTRNKIISLRRLLQSITISKAFFHTIHNYLNSQALTMTINSFHDSQFYTSVNHHTSILVSCGQTSFLVLGVIACSISAQPKKGGWLRQTTSICGNQSMHVPRCDIMCPLPCSCGYPKKGVADLCLYQLRSYKYV